MWWWRMWLPCLKHKLWVLPRSAVTGGAISVCTSAIGGIRRGGSLVEAGRVIEIRWGMGRGGGIVGEGGVILTAPPPSHHPPFSPVQSLARPASSVFFPSELELLGHFGGDVSEGQGRPPQALEPHPAALAQPAGQLADLRLEGHAGASGAVSAGQQEGPRQVDLAAAALRRLAQGQHHLGRVPRAPHPHIPAASGGPGLGRFLMPR